MKKKTQYKNIATIRRLDDKAKGLLLEQLLKEAPETVIASFTKTERLLINKQVPAELRKEIASLCAGGGTLSRAKAVQRLRSEMDIGWKEGIETVNRIRLSYDA